MLDIGSLHSASARMQRRPSYFSQRNPSHLSAVSVADSEYSTGDYALQTGGAPSKTELKKSEATKAVDAVFEAITAALKEGEEVRLVGFGTFSVASRAESEGRNSRTGEKIKIAASKSPKFTAGATLKTAVSGRRK